MTARGLLLFVSDFNRLYMLFIPVYIFRVLHVVIQTLHSFVLVCVRTSVYFIARYIFLTI